MLSVLVWTSLLFSSVLSGCPQIKNEGVPRFTRRMGGVDMVPLGKYITLLCCAAGYDNITWHRLEAGKWRDYPPPLHPGSSLQPRTSDHGQVLEIFSASIGDSTTYKCEIYKDSTSVLEHSIKLIVEACASMNRGPILTDPFPMNQTVDELGGTVTFSCTGYFGCDDDLSLVMWMLKNKTKIKTNKRYNVTTITSDSGTRVQVMLVISPVEEEDLHTEFTCLIASPQLIHSQTSMVARIFKREKPGSLEVILYIVFGSIIFVIIVGLSLFFGIRSLYGPQIVLLWRSRFRKLKPINGDGLEHNVFIYHADDDQGAAEKIKKKLVEKHYNVFMTSNVDGHEVKLARYQEEITKSALIVFLYSQNLREDRISNFILQSLIEERKGRDILFIEIEKYVPQDVMDWTKKQIEYNARNVEATANGDLAMNDENEIAVGADRDNVDANRPNHDDNDANGPDRNNAAPDLTYWKALPRLKYLPEDASQRIQNNFWASLYNKIPKFNYQIQADRNRRGGDIERGGRGRVSSSGQQLLPETPRTPSPTADDVENIVTPSRDEVFRYDVPYDDEQTRVKQTVEPIPHDHMHAGMKQDAEHIPYGHMGVGGIRNENPAFLPSLTSSEGAENETGRTSVAVGYPTENQVPHVVAEIHHSNEANSDQSAVSDCAHPEVITMSGEETQVKRLNSDEATHSHNTTSPERLDSGDHPEMFTMSGEEMQVKRLNSDEATHSHKVAPAERSDSSNSKDSGAQFSDGSVQSPVSSPESGAQFSDGSVQSPVSSPESGYASYPSGNTRSTLEGQDISKRRMDEVSESRDQTVPVSEL